MIKIISDTLSTLSVAEANALGVPYQPQFVIIDGVEYRDDYGLDTPTFLKLLATAKTLPKTSAPAPELYTPIYRELLDQGHTIIVISPSADVSGTFRGASVAAQEFADAPIHIIDVRSVGSGTGNMVRKAVEAVNSGKSVDEVISIIRDLASRERIYFLVDTLDYLYKGGRIGGAAKLVGGVLQIKPILTVHDGRVEPLEKQRTKQKAISRIKELILQECPHDDRGMLTIMECGAEDEANELAAFFEKELNISKVEVTRIPPAIAVHAGPGVLGFSFFVE